MNTKLKKIVIIFSLFYFYIICILCFLWAVYCMYFIDCAVQHLLYKKDGLDDWKRISENAKLQQHLC